jgi:hypothetical protein
MSSGVRPITRHRDFGWQFEAEPPGELLLLWVRGTEKTAVVAAGYQLAGRQCDEGIEPVVT